jgi:hypothetical protein
VTGTRRRAGLQACFAAGFALSILASSPASAQSTQAPVVHASIDRTAVWVADRGNYAGEIVCPKGVDILYDDVAK